MLAQLFGIDPAQPHKEVLLSQQALGPNQCWHAMQLCSYAASCHVKGVQLLRAMVAGGLLLMLPLAGQVHPACASTRLQTSA